MLSAVLGPMIIPCKQHHTSLTRTVYKRHITSQQTVHCTQDAGQAQKTLFTLYTIHLQLWCPLCSV